MKNVFAILFCMMFFVAAFAAETQHFTKNQVFLTHDGIFVNLNGFLTPVDGIEYLGNGIYQCERPYYGNCGRCGWPVKENGQCQNRNCNQYGPGEK